MYSHSTTNHYSIPCRAIREVPTAPQNNLGIYSQLLTYWLGHYSNAQQHQCANIYTFKTIKCTLKYQHLASECSCYHSELDRRRPLMCYSSKLCKYTSQTCPLGEQCPNSHNRIEQLYHLEQFKTKYCLNQRFGFCKYGSTCTFAHSESELAVPMLDKYELNNWFYVNLFKTVWCPFAEKHNKAVCVYAHNWQDFRRRPNLFSYTNEMCPYWDGNKFVTSYESGCPYKAACNYCHGWKELQYHPKNYKTSPCTSYHHKENHCYCYHSMFDIRNNESSNLESCLTLYGKLCMTNLNDQMLILDKQSFSWESFYYVEYEECGTNLEHNSSISSIIPSNSSIPKFTQFWSDSSIPTINRNQDYSTHSLSNEGAHFSLRSLS